MKWQVSQDYNIFNIFLKGGNSSEVLPRITSVIRQKGESQNTCFKKAKHAKKHAPRNCHSQATPFLE